MILQVKIICKIHTIGTIPLFIASQHSRLSRILKQFCLTKILLTHSWRRPLSYRNPSIDLLGKSMDWFLYGNGLRHERVQQVQRVDYSSFIYFFCYSMNDSFNPSQLYILLTNPRPTSCHRRVNNLTHSMLIPAY